MDTKKEARAAYAKIRHQTEEGNYAEALRPVLQRLGARKTQELCEEDIDELVHPHRTGRA